MIIPKILGQLAPTAGSLALLYRAPILTNTTAHTLMVCNRSNVANTFRIAVAPRGEADNIRHYIYYDHAVAGNETRVATLDLKLTDLDEVRVYTPSATLSFALFGAESL